MILIDLRQPGPTNRKFALEIVSYKPVYLIIS